MVRSIMLKQPSTIKLNKASLHLIRLSFHHHCNKHDIMNDK